MRSLKYFLIIFSFLLFSTSVLASELFSKFNKDLVRVGEKELHSMVDADFESGDYRLSSDFKIGYGDVVEVRLTGKLEAAYQITVDREGSILIPLIGNVRIADMTIDEAGQVVKEKVDEKYSNVESHLYLASVQDIRIYALGNVVAPGSYALSPFCSLVQALIKAGGPSETGTLADIRVLRNGEQVASLNIYDFLFKGDQSNNVRLSHGDTLFVPNIKGRIALRGDVIRPGIYEINGDITLREVISSSIDGMLPTAIARKIYIVRIDPKQGAMKVFGEIIVGAQDEIKGEDNITLINEDTVIVTDEFSFLTIKDNGSFVITTPRQGPDLYSQHEWKSVKILGEVKFPGEYFLNENETLRSLVEKAGGLKDTAFAEGAIFTRRSLKDKEESILEELLRSEELHILQEEALMGDMMLPQAEKVARMESIERKRRALDLMITRTPTGRIIIDLEDVIVGRSDMVVEEGDSLYIPSVPEWVLVCGAVYNPVSVVFKKGELLEYYLNAVGGPTKSADTDNIYVIKPTGLAESKTTGYSAISQGDIIIVPQNKE